MRLFRHSHAWIVALIIATLTVTGCAAKGARNKTRVAALTVGESLLAVADAERDLYAGNAYPKATHDQINTVLLQALHAGQTFERAAAAWTDGDTAPERVTAAREVLLATLDELEKVIPGSVQNRAVIVTAVRAVRIAIGGVQ